VQYYVAAQDIALPHALASTLPAGGAGIDPPGTTAPGAVFQYTVGRTAAAPISDDLPREYTLFTNYPNPFNPATEIEYDLPKAGRVTLNIYDITGKRVAALVDHDQAPGRYRVRFDASNLASGIYFCQLNAGEFTARNKMLLIR
jgi:hypothetical protein